jgi:hypothetical protein
LAEHKIRVDVTAWFSMVAVVATLSLAARCSSGPARAQPVFPDLSRYSPVNVADFTIAIPDPGRGSSNSIFFPTPDANACMLVNATAECTGNKFPGISPDN